MMPPRSSTPLSEACEVGSVCSRRPSVTSLGQFDDPPEVDLSHLSVEERAKIAAVMERARQAQDEEADRIRWVHTMNQRSFGLRMRITHNGIRRQTNSHTNVVLLSRRVKPN